MSVAATPELPNEPLIAWRLGKVEKGLESKADKDDVKQIRVELAQKADRAEVALIRSDIKDLRDAIRTWAITLVSGGFLLVGSGFAAVHFIHIG